MPVSFREQLSSMSPWLLVLLVGALAYLALVAMRLVLVDTPLGYDESVYALGGRGLLTGAPESGFEPYRPAGMRIVSALGVALGGSEIALRSVSIMLALGCVLALWWLGACATSTMPATWAAVVLVTSHELHRRSAQLLSDLPSLLFILLAMAVMVRELRREHGPTWSFLLVAPLAAAAFYLRYGSLLTLAVLAVALVAVWWKTIWAARRIVLATAAVFIALMVPHLVHSVMRTGKIMGLLSSGAKVAGRTYIGDGVVFYMRAFPEEIGGRIVGIALILGLVYGALLVIRVARRRAHARQQSEDRALVFLFLVAVLHSLGVGLLAHGEARFVFLGTFLLILVAVTALTRVVPKPDRRIWYVGLVALCMYSECRLVRTRQGVVRSGESHAVPAAAGRLIRRDAGTDACVVLSSSTPQITWYSGCETRRIHPTSPRKALQAIDRLKQPRKYMVLFDKARRQPKKSVLDAMRGRTESAPLGRIDDLSGRGNHATVYRFP